MKSARTNVDSSPAANDDSQGVLVEVPRPVEGRIPTKAEMTFKASNGRYYLEDVWVIEMEFPTAHHYETATNLPQLVNSLYTQVRDVGYVLHDSSNRLNGVKHALELTLAWAQIVREARTTDTMHIVRRTPENSGAMLMIQRQEHLRGQCSEMAPIAYIALVRDDQFVVTRDRVADQDSTERMLLKMAKSKDDCCICGEFLRRRESTTLTGCGHCVHIDCLKRAVGDGVVACPLCKVELHAADKCISGFSALGNYSSSSEKREEAIERAKLSGDRRHLTNMPHAFFNQQIQAMVDSMKAISLHTPEREPWVEIEIDVSDRPNPPESSGALNQPQLPPSHE